MRRHRCAWFGLALALWPIGGPAGRASSAEDRYILSRDRAVARFGALAQIGERMEAEKARVRADLERQLRTILGPVRPPGFDAGKLNVTTLLPDSQGFGRLDGLLFETDGGDREMIVTTPSLMIRWLRMQEDWQETGKRPLEAAIRRDAFYSRVARVAAAAVRFVELPLEVRARQSGHAILAGRTQDRVPNAAGGVFVAAIKGERAFVANAALKPMFAIEACTVARSDAEERLAQSLGGGPGTDPEGAALLERFGAMRDKIDADFLRCFAERAPHDPRFADAMKLAQDLYDRMPAR